MRVYLGIWAITNILLVLKSGFNVEALQRFDSEVGRNVAPLSFHSFAIYLCTVLSDQRSWTLFVSMAVVWGFLQSMHFSLWLGTNGNPTVFDILRSGINTTVCAREHHGQVPACPSLSCSVDFPPCTNAACHRARLTYILTSPGILENPRPLVSAHPSFIKVIMLSLSRSVSHTQPISSFMTHWERSLQSPKQLLSWRMLCAV